MKQYLKQKRFTWAALLLALPTAYFITISLLDEIGISGPLNSIYPWLEQVGIREPIGWNINLLILLGPVAACMLTAFQLLDIKLEFSRESFKFQFTIHKRWFPLLVTAFSLSLLAFLSFYLFRENCNC